MDADHAEDILIALHSPGLYLALREGRGWTDQKVTDWMAETIPELMMRPAPDPHPHDETTAPN